MNVEESKHVVFYETDLVKQDSSRKVTKEDDLDVGFQKLKICS